MKGLMFNVMKSSKDELEEAEGSDSEFVSLAAKNPSCGVKASF